MSEFASKHWGGRYYDRFNSDRVIQCEYILINEVIIFDKFFYINKLINFYLTQIVSVPN